MEGTVIEIGVTRTVYSLLYPEVRAVIDKLAKGFPHDLYTAPYSKKQDAMHAPLFEEWMDWARDVVEIPDNEFPFRYPTAGSSEGIREAITDHHVKNPAGRLVVFEGEYEGYQNFAKNIGMTVVFYDRRKADQLTPDHFQDGDLFILSQPSSIDGNFWSGYDDLLGGMSVGKKNITVFLDLAYVGCTPAIWSIDVPPIVKTVFFSLSKAFGVYYHRIGGVFSREEIPGLYGNMWFKNLFSIRLGVELLRTFRVNTLPFRYRELQKQAVSTLMSQGVQARESDVLLLAFGSEGDLGARQDMYRGSGSYRYCLTPMIDRAIHALPLKQSRQGIKKFKRGTKS